MPEDYYRKRAEKRLIIISLVIVICAVAYWYFFRTGTLTNIVSFENSLENFAVEQIAKTMSAPPPLVGTGAAAPQAKPQAGQYTLTRSGIIADTNAERNQNGGLPALSGNATLDQIATLRLNDMFAKQYFAHVSPASSSAITLAKTVGYDYLSLGENLALGNFKGDADVVTAWMNSPGHRENILNQQYTEIGVAARAGIFEGKSTWIAVQVFGRPASDCPKPSANQRAQIDADQTQVSQMESNLQSMRAELDAMYPKYGPEYNQAVNNYNTAVEQYNSFIAQIKSEIAQYNAAVEAFNQCIGA